ncbi:hypothetical protein [Clostridium sp. HCS.1]|uniref:hypothetical protein n=1 Tax=Clostridium sp. HCS.1 TaxID=3238594 RepID=UPI003A0FBB71
MNNKFEILLIENMTDEEKAKIDEDISNGTVKIRVVPINGNQCGYLSPSQFGGLGYHCYSKSSMYSDVYHIPTQSFGEVQILVPKDRDACIKPYTISYPMNGPHK